MYVKCNTVARLGNHCCSVNATTRPAYISEIGNFQQYNKTGNESMNEYWGAFVQPLLQ